MKTAMTPRTVLCVAACTLACGTTSNTNDAGSDGGADVVSVDAPVEASPGDSGNDASNACATAPTTDFYVNAATGDDTNNGAAPSCAFKTLSAALTASASHASSTIHAAAGSYGAGETFPLVLDKGRSLVGAGASSTTIQGSSSAYNTSSTGSFLDTGTHYVTLLAGDGSTTVTVSGFTFLPQSTVTTPTANYLGVVCIAGNAPNTGASPPLPAANLVLQGITVGPNFDTGVSISSSPSSSTGCNAAINASTFTGSNVGVATGVCGGSNPVNSWPSAQVGDGTTGNANTFTASGIDVFGEGCGSVQSYNDNKFESGYRGIVLVSTGSQYFEVLGNTFDGTAGPLPMGIGVNTNATAVLDKLNGNTFTNISESSAADTAVGATTGYAIAMGAGRIIQAHGNSINNNDNGIIFAAGTTLSNFDFSSDGTSSNANQIYCNSKPSVSSAVGYDLVVQGTPTLNFAGNVWDHATPSTGLSTTLSANGTDVVGGFAGVTLTGSTATSQSCLGTRVH